MSEPTEPQPLNSEPPASAGEMPALDMVIDEIARSASEDAGSGSDDAPHEHARRAAESLLGLLDGDVSPPQGLADVTMLRVKQLQAGEQSPDRLDSLDAEALDAMVASGFDADRLPGMLRDRGRALALAGEAVTTGGPGVPEGLAERTMARVSGTSAEIHRQPLRFPMRQRFTDLVSIAAMLLLMVSIGWPAMVSWRSAAQRVACESGMRSVASAVGAYGGDFREQLPAAMAGFGGGQTWWNVGQGADQSNSANLYTLTRAGYTPLDRLACVGNEHAPHHGHEPGATDWRSLQEVSYSYRIIVRGSVPRLSDERFVIAADRSPVVLRAVRGEPIRVRENSPNHGGRGQTVLFSDGSASWQDSPVLDSGENIFLPRPIEVAVARAERMLRMQPIDGTEIPDQAGDDFVGP